MPNPTEEAVLIVNGREFKDWESVLVRHEIGGKPPYLARFTCSEGLPINKNLALLQIKPGDDCAIYLAGFKAFEGKIETRQVYVDGYRHHVELQAATFVEIMKGSVISKTMEWKDRTFPQIAEDILGKLGIRIKYEGGSPPTAKYPRASAMHGQTMWDFLEMLARSIKTQTGAGINFTSNENGDFVIVMGSNDQRDQVIEGKNMLVGREIIHRPSASGAYPVLSQGPGNDKVHGAQAYSKPYATLKDDSVFTTGAPAFVTVAEIPTYDTEVLKARARNDHGWSADDEIRLILTVQGWLRPTGGLWFRNQKVNVYSEMLMMRGDSLKLKSVTFTQTNQGGTRTDLELTNEAAGSGGRPGIR